MISVARTFELERRGEIMLTRCIRTAAIAALLVVPVVQAGQDILLGGGSRSGVYYQVALQLCAEVNRAAGDRINCKGRPSLGSVFNIDAVARGLLAFGVAQSDRVWQAIHGEADWAKKGPVDHLRSLFTVHPETVLLVVRSDSGIRSVTDLRGRRVNIGNPGSGQRGNAGDVLRIYGVDAMKDIRAEGLQQSDASRALIDGKIDAFFFTVGNPSAAIMEPARGPGIDLISLDSPEIRAFVDSRPYYVMTSVPASTYPGVSYAVPTFAVKATLVTRADTSEELVYTVVKALFENFARFRNSHEAFRYLQPSEMLEGLSAPLHAGAVRYFREVGLTLPAR